MAQAGAGKGRFDQPRDIARDAQGNFFVADTQNERIEKFDIQGKWLLAFGSKGSGDGQFAPISPEAKGTGPGGLAVDKAGNVYVADTWNHRIQKFDPSGKFLAAWGSFLNLSDPNSANEPDKNARFYGPRGVASGPDDSIYVTDTGNKRVLVFDTNGKPQRQISIGSAPDRAAPDYPFDKPGELNEPMGIVVDKTGNVYVADTNNHRIQKFDASGKYAAAWPVPKGAWDPGQYLEPFLGVDALGNVYATAPTAKAVLKYSPEGQLLGQKQEARGKSLNLPTGLQVDPDGTVYVVDTGANGVIELGKIP
jgi:sugar lactone lactonase YvrE